MHGRYQIVQIGLRLDDILAGAWSRNRREVIAWLDKPAGNVEQ